MNAGQLLQKFSLVSAIDIPEELDILAATQDHRKVQKGYAFFAMKGTYRDGRDFIAAAVAAGAAIVFAEQDEKYSISSQYQGTPIIVVPDLAKKIGFMATEIYDHPSHKLEVIAITGTNGKTSNAHFLAQAFTALNKKVAVLGTLGNGVFGELAQSSHTTLDACSLQELLRDFVAKQVEFVVLEASSHGLEQGRLHGVKIDTAVFTNLTRDHLDYHQTMEAYANAKAKLFSWPTLKNIVLNADDEQSAYFASLSTDAAFKVFYSQSKSSANVVLQQADLVLSGMKLDIKTPNFVLALNLPLLGLFNIANVLSVLSVVLSYVSDQTSVEKALTALKPISGRMESVVAQDITAVIDYAHTPDALENVLKSLRAHCSGKLWCVFGCGGDRDAGKRPLMGAIAEQYADKVVVTSDNPRSEQPSVIVEQIIKGMTLNKTHIVEDRKQAIVYALRHAQKNDIVLLAGKGHEDYQEINGQRFYFNDKEEVEKYFFTKSIVAE
jgi:UDP-N-acetylmuramoyl-L-alanyl-D-glutamate--2,6-diaminopimelate ligase